jgi:signal transduction histidine kinase
MDYKWPFTPSHISNDLSNIGLKGNGLISNEELRGFQTIISANIENPSALYEFYGKTVYRTDSILEEYDLVKPCRLFRKCTNQCYCLEQDQKFAALFKGLYRENLLQKLEKRLKSTAIPPHSLPPEWQEPNIDTIDSRPYIYYDCPFLGYRELVFPIFFKNSQLLLSDSSVGEQPEDSVIAVFILGQIFLQTNKKNVNQIRKHFFSSLRKKKGNQNTKISSLDLFKIGRLNSYLWKTSVEKTKVKSDKEYKDLFLNAHHQLSGLEDKLYHRHHQARERFALIKVDNAIRELHNYLPTHDISILDDTPLSRFWDNISNRLTELCRNFNFYYVAVFALDDPLAGTEEKLPMVAYGVNQRMPNIFKPQNKSLYYETSNIPQNADRSEFTSVNNPMLIRGLPRNWPNRKRKKNITILTYPLPFHPKTPIVVVCGHQQNSGPCSFDFLEAALRTFDAAVVSILASVLERLAEQKTTHAFRVLRHETEPQTRGLKGLAQVYLGDSKKIRELTEKKGKDICLDIDEYLDRINYLFANARSLLTILLEKRKLSLDREPIKVIGQMFYKYKDLFRAFLDDRGMNMPLEKAIDDPKWPEINADRRLLDLSIFNLLTNAYKYGNRGTNIFMQYYKADWHIIKVTNFSPGIDSKQDIFRLFVRSTDNQGEEGAGIGLAISIAIAESHGGTLTFKQNEISKFNVPFISSLIDYHENAPSLGSKAEINQLLMNAEQILDIELNLETFIKMLYKEKERLSGISSNIVSARFNTKWGYFPFPNECIDRILTPTTKVSFIVKLPH